jgi:alpha-glucosidase
VCTNPASIPLANHSPVSSHIKGGSIIPARINSTNTTAELRNVDFELLIAPDNDGKAVGSLYLDDGESIEQNQTSEIEFRFEGGKVVAEGTFGFKTSVRVKSVTVMGEGEPAKYEVDEGLEAGWEHDLQSGGS